MSRKEERSGLGALLAGLRLTFENPLVKLALKSSLGEYECVYTSGERVKTAAIYHALAYFAGLKFSSCPITVRFLSTLLDKVMAVVITMLRGSVDEAREALRDPALRRGVALVLRGLAMYGVTVPQELPAPFLVVWNFTNMCNLRCLHCYQRADKPLPDELTWNEKLKVIEDLDRAGLAAIALSGGEPTIHPDFYRAVYEIARRGMYAAVATNGWVFADIEKLQKAVKLGLRYVEVSVDSANPRKHDWFRGVPGSWKRAVKALENAVKLGVNHAMAVTITKANINEVDEILDLAESIGVKRVVFFNFVPTGRGKENLWLDLDPIERERFLKKIYREIKRRGIEIVSTAPQYGRVVLQMSGFSEAAPTHFYVGGDPISKALAEFVGGCGAGRIYAAIQPNGDVVPCVFLPIRVGSLREVSFTEIWVKSPLLRALRDRSKLEGFCGKCPYRNVCGGCRARAYAYFNDPLAPDPGCIYNLRDWRKLVEELRKRVENLTVKEKAELVKTVVSTS